MVKKFFRIIIIYFVMISFRNALAFEVPVRSSGDLIFSLDGAAFRAAEGRVLYEFYYNFPLKSLNFQKTEQGYRDSLQLNFSVINDADSVLMDEKWSEPIFVDSLEKLEGLFFPGQLEIVIKPGKYRVSLAIEDVNSGKKGTANQEIVVSSFPDKELCISEIQLASHIKKSSKGRFIKNGVNIVPNPNRIFGFTLPMIYFYVEIYNLSPQQPDTYTLKYSVWDINNKLIRDYPVKVHQKPGESCFEIGAINIISLKRYSAAIFSVSVIDNTTGKVVTANKKFWLVSELPLQPVTHNAAEQKIKAMTSQELEKHFKQISYILPQQLIDNYNKLNLEGKKNLLISFWVANDPHPETPENEFWNIYFKNVEYANQHFSSSFTEGWKTDRGRIFLKYGKPDEVEYYPLSRNSKPFEIWQYYEPEQMKFIFVDEEGFKRYRLIYSSDEKEITDPNWKNIITLPY